MDRLSIEALIDRNRERLALAQSVRNEAKKAEMTAAQARVKCCDPPPQEAIGYRAANLRIFDADARFPRVA